MAVGNLWRHFQRGLRYTGRIYIAPGHERYCVWTLPSRTLFSNFLFAAKGYLEKREADPAAVVCLGDSAYHRSNMKQQLGFGLPVPQRKDGVQQKVRVFTFCSTHTHVRRSKGGRGDKQPQGTVSAGRGGADDCRFEACQSHEWQQIERRV